jgi:hypothetical protein
MPSTTHMATIADDERHAPGPDSLPLWNESYWFPIYDPQTEIGVVVRAGVYGNQQTSNVYLFITHKGAIIHTWVEQRAPLPPLEPRRLVIGGLTIDIEQPLERLRLRYTAGNSGFDLLWEGYSPAYMYPRPPDVPFQQYPGHIEQSAVVTGTVTIGGEPYAIDCLGHRDHSWGGERDWNKFYGWDYLNVEFGRDAWFHAVRFELTPGNNIYIGGLWDGTELHEGRDIRLDIKTADGGTRQTGCDWRMQDERGREYHIVGEQVLTNLIVRFQHTWLKDGIARFRWDGRIGYGIHEHGYLEELRH